MYKLVERGPEPLGRVDSLIVWLVERIAIELHGISLTVEMNASDVFSIMTMNQAVEYEQRRSIKWQVIVTQWNEERGIVILQELLKKIEELEKKTSCGSFAPPQLEDSRKWMQAMLAQKQ